MRRHACLSALAGFASLAAIAAASPALAGSVSFVSSKGVDNGNCGLAASPCRTFAYALTQTNASGEIKVLDPGFYNTVAINKSVTITGVPGTSIAMTAPNTAITIDAGANGIVNLRGIEINGQGVGLAGISVLSAKAVNIVDCIVRRVGADGISISPNSGAVSATISNTISSNNGNFGMQFVPGFGASVKASIDHSTMNDNGFAGVMGSDGAALMITDSNADNNAIDGFRAAGGATSLMWLGRNVATGNSVGIKNVTSASVRSFGDNKVIGNATNTSGAIVTVAHK
ncbi:MAG TPA: right-handed parallel beta-helix repeat-containing protein [Methylosinus sp.]|jgi:hypothetical protein